MSAEAAAAGADFMKFLIGQKQLGASAPPFMPQMGAFSPLGFGSTSLGGAAPSLIPTQQGPSIEDLIGSPQARGMQVPQQAAPQVLPQGNGFVGPPTLENDPTQFTPPVTPGKEAATAGKSNPFNQFFGNVDQTLQSPSKVLGLGLLGQIDPRLGIAGLIASGFLNGR
jgi:hypothetical protein